MIKIYWCVNLFFVFFVYIQAIYTLVPDTLMTREAVRWESSCSAQETISRYKKLTSILELQDLNRNTSKLVRPL